MAEAEGTPRKSSRVRKPTSKALENQFVKNLARSGFVGNISSESDYSSSEYESFEEDKSPEKPKSKKSTPSSCKRKSNSTKPEVNIEESESSYSDEESNTDSGKNEKSPQSPVKLNIKKTPSLKKRKDPCYTMKTDEFFSNQTTKKNVTSNHSLDDLSVPRLDQEQLQSLLKNMTLSKNHREYAANLNTSNKSMFVNWFYLLHENFNILLYGLGSKRQILNQFHNDYLKKSPVVEVNGFFPTLSIKDILDSIINDLLELKNNSLNAFECCNIIEQEFENLPDTHLYLIVHNIDGEMLRNKKAQNVLGRLAGIKNIHLIASVDHINAPLIWNYSKLSQFNFTWWNSTSFQSYFEETSFESSMMLNKSGNFALSSLKNVFHSLTTNSKGIYTKIIQHQLKNSKNKCYQGLAFKDLYTSCREDFLVSSDLALRAQLTEFVDHKMIKLKRSLDGVEYLNIPIQNNLLQTFLDEQNNVAN